MYGVKSKKIIVSFESSGLAKPIIYRNFEEKATRNWFNSMLCKYVEEKNSLYCVLILQIWEENAVLCNYLKTTLFAQNMLLKC